MPRSLVRVQIKQEMAISGMSKRWCSSLRNIMNSLSLAANWIQINAYLSDLCDKIHDIGGMKSENK